MSFTSGLCLRRLGGCSQFGKRENRAEKGRKIMKKVLIVRHELNLSDYEEARQYFDDEEIRTILKEDGENELRNKLAAYLAQNRRQEFLAERRKS